MKPEQVFFRKKLTQNKRIVTSAISLTVTKRTRLTAGPLVRCMGRWRDVREGNSSLFRQTFLHRISETGVFRWSAWFTMKTLCGRTKHIVSLTWHQLHICFFGHFLFWMYGLERLGSSGQGFLDQGHLRYYYFWMYGFGKVWIFWSGAFGDCHLPGCFTWRFKEFTTS